MPKEPNRLPRSQWGRFKRLNWTLAAGVALLAGCGPSYRVVEHEYDSQKTDRENLLGEWVCVEATTAGEPAPDLVGKALDFRKEHVRMMARPRNNEWVQMPWKLDDEGENRFLVMNASPVSSPIPTLLVWLYRFENGSLVISRSEMRSMPQSFYSTPETGYSLLIYKRVE